MPLLTVYHVARSHLCFNFISDVDYSLKLECCMAVCNTEEAVLFVFLKQESGDVM